MNVSAEVTYSTLDSVAEQLETGRISSAMDALFEHLLDRRTENSSAWEAECAAIGVHPLRQMLHQDPFTYRAFAKPRGYAGDAVMMDYIYGLGEAAEAESGASPLGREIFRHIGTRPSAKSVRYRRRLIASLIDGIAAKGGMRVLALASGHLREAELSNATLDGKLEEYVAFDQDRLSLDVVSRDYARLGIKAVHGSVRQILAGKAGLGDYDFVYAAGLFDYLSNSVAQALIERMFAMTRPGGTLLIPNFARGIRDVGYMESFMAWRLIYRDRAGMLDMCATLPEERIERRQVFNDPYDTVTYLQITKAGCKSRHPSCQKKIACSCRGFE